MATGDSNDILNRIRAAISKGWFQYVAPARDALLGGLASGLAFVYSLLSYIQNQTRIASASDFFLDLAAFDFFGLRIQRRPGQPDSTFSPQIRKEVLRTRVTRPGIIRAVNDLTQTAVSMFEPENPQDSGGWGTYLFAFDASGGWGAQLSYTTFITAVQPVGAGIPNLSGFDDSYGGWGSPPYAFVGTGWSNGFSSGFGNLYGFGLTGGQFALADPTLISGAVTNADIYSQIEANRGAGITCWVNITTPPITPSRLDIDFILDKSMLS